MSRPKEWAQGLAREPRGILVLTLIGGGAAAIGGVIFTGLVILLEYGMPFSREMPHLVAGVLGEIAAVFFVGGAIITGGFATLLSVMGRTLALRRLSVARGGRGNRTDRDAGGVDVGPPPGPGTPPCP